MKLVKNFLPFDWLTTGRSDSWENLARAPGQIAFLLGGSIGGSAPSFSADANWRPLNPNGRRVLFFLVGCLSCAHRSFVVGTRGSCLYSIGTPVEVPQAGQVQCRLGCFGPAVSFCDCICELVPRILIMAGIAPE